MHLSLGGIAPGLALLLGLPLLASAAATNTTRALETPGKPHSLTESYQFDPRDGWESVMITNLRYKYRRSPLSQLPAMSSAATPGEDTSNALSRPSVTNIDQKKNALRSIRKSIAVFTKSIFGFGKAEPVIITWYTGHDLLNPSCWSDPTWAPTDESLVAAITLVGWSGKPQCFDFLELCSNTTHCTFARVVDTCAGCKEGSKHVDLTRAAFSQLAALEEGVLTAWMRRASEPKVWDVALWGPRQN